MKEEQQPFKIRKNIQLIGSIDFVIMVYSTDWVILTKQKEVADEITIIVNRTYKTSISKIKVVAEFHFPLLNDRNKSK